MTNNAHGEPVNIRGWKVKFVNRPSLSAEIILFHYYYRHREVFRVCGRETADVSSMQWDVITGPGPL